MQLKRGLIVSCQADKGSALYGPHFMSALAQAAQAGGAVAIRADGPEDIAAIKARVSVPVIGLWKLEVVGFEPYITPSLASAQGVAAAGADLLALDATSRPHPEGTMAETLAAAKALGLPLFADVATANEGVAAEAAGAAYVSTTLAGYTPYTTQTEGPDFALIRDLVGAVSVPVVAEGRFWTPEHVAEAFTLGVHAVVVGTAITDPRAITRRFVAATS